ncbi:hypothetical protein THAOC_20078, partial [Thalassiosira oceanica]
MRDTSREARWRRTGRPDEVGPSEVAAVKISQRGATTGQLARGILNRLTGGGQHQPTQARLAR